MSPAPLPMCRLIPLHEFDRPAEPTTEVINNRVRRLWKQIFAASSTEDTAPIKLDDDLQTVPRSLLDWIVPQPQWDLLLENCDIETLYQWIHLPEEEANLYIVVCPPYSGLQQLIRTWCSDQPCTLITPPSTSEILAGAADWMEQWVEDSTTHLVLPNLERVFLRHHQGLTLLRRLFDWLLVTPCSGLMLCDSWAWSYLNKVLPIRSLSANILTLAPFDADALGLWLRELSGGPNTGRFTFRQANTGKPILLPKVSELDSGEIFDEAPGKYFLRHLAARSRGNPGVARAIWRRSLLISQTDDVHNRALEEAELDLAHTVWVRPWAMLDLPEVPGDLGPIGPYLLHTLLLHNGLPADILPELLPFAPAQIIDCLYRLARHKLIAEKARRWSVAGDAYPAVRAYLKLEGYLVDEL